MTVKKEDNGTWSVRCWYRDWRGDRKQKTKRGFLKQKDAKQWEREFLAQEHKQIITMSGLVNAYLLFLKDQEEIGAIKDSTYEYKKDDIERYIKPYFKDADTAHITTKVVNSWIVWLNKNFGRNGLASSTQKNVVNRLSQIFQYGIKHYNLALDPTRGAAMTTGITTDTRVPYWDVDTYNKFYDSLKEGYYKVIFNIMYWAGLRVSEVLGITPSDVQDRTLIVQKQWRAVPHRKSRIGSVKTKSSDRIVILPQFVYEQLQAYIKVNEFEPTDRIFPISRMAVYKMIKKKIEKLGLPNASPHTLRHSYASNFIGESKDYVSAAAQLGHSSPKMTFQTYAHLRKDIAQNSVDLLEKLHKN